MDGGVLVPLLWFDDVVGCLVGHSMDPWNPVRHLLHGVLNIVLNVRHSL